MLDKCNTGCPCLFLPRQSNTNGISFIFVTLSKVAKASTGPIAVAGVFMTKLCQCKCCSKLV